MQGSNSTVVQAAVDIVDGVQADILRAARLSHLENWTPGEAVARRNQRVTKWIMQLKSARKILREAVVAETRTKRRKLLVDAYAWTDEVIRVPEASRFNELFYLRREQILDNCRLACA